MSDENLINPHRQQTDRPDLYKAGWLVVTCPPGFQDSPPVLPAKQTGILVRAPVQDYEPHQLRDLRRGPGRLTGGQNQGGDRVGPSLGGFVTSGGREERSRRMLMI